MKRIVSFLMLLPIMVGVSVFTTSCSDDDQFIGFNIATGGTAAEGIEVGKLDPNVQLNGSLIFAALNEPTNPQTDSIMIVSKLDWTHEFTTEDWFSVDVEKRPSGSEASVAGIIYVAVDDYNAESSVGSRVAYITINASNGETFKIAIVQAPLLDIPDNPTAEDLRGDYRVSCELVPGDNAPTAWKTSFYQMATVDNTGNVDLTNEMGSVHFSDKSWNGAFIFYFEVRKDSNGKMTPILNTRIVYPDAGGPGVHGYIGALYMSGSNLTGIATEIEGRWDNTTKSIIFPADPNLEIGIGLIAFNDAGGFLGTFTDLYKTMTFTAMKKNPSYIGAFDANIGRPKGAGAPAVSSAPQMALQLKEIMK